MTRGRSRPLARAELGLEEPGVPSLGMAVGIIYCAHCPGGECLKSVGSRGEGGMDRWPHLPGCICLSQTLAAVWHGHAVAVTFQLLLLSACDTPLRKRLA